MPDIEKVSKPPSRLDTVNMKLSPLTSIVGAVLIYDGLNHNSESLVIGGSLALLAGFGLKDLATRNRNKTQELVIFESIDPKTEETK